MSSFLQDLRLAGRRLIRAPAFALPSWTALTLGIGGVSAAFSVVYAVMLTPLPFPDPQRLVVIRQNIPSLSDLVPFGPMHFEALQASAKGIEGMAAVDLIHFNLRGEEGTERLNGAQATSQFFDLLAVAPILGRPFTGQEWQSKSAGTALVSHALWQRRLGGTDAVLGSVLNVEATYSGPQRHVPSTLTVVGILPPGFHSPWGDIDIWIPFQPDRTPQAFRYPYINVLVRLSPQLTIQAARRQLEQSYQAIEFQDRLPQQDRGLTIFSLPERRVRMIRSSLLMLWAASGLVLLIACANVATLMLARSGRQASQMALRAVLGASRARLMRLALMESILLAVAGTVSGVALAGATVRLLEAYNPGVLPAHLSLHLRPAALLFTGGVSSLTVLLFGLLPAWRISRPDLRAPLQEAGRTLVWSPRRARAGRLLVASEIALALILLVCAGLVSLSLSQLQGTDPGFRAVGAHIFRLDLPPARYPEAAQQEAVVQRLLQRYQSLPGVESAGVSSMLPLTLVNAIAPYRLEGAGDGDDEQSFRSNLRRVSPDYLEAMEIPLLRGRTLRQGDMADPPRVAVVSQALVRRHWPDGSGLGEQILLGGSDAPLQIVGVVQDVRQWMLSQEGGPAIYVPRHPGPRLSFVIRSASDMEQLATLIRSEATKVDPQLAVFDLASLESLLDRATARSRFDAWLMGVFAAVALVLAVVGIYGLSSFIVAGRRHEVGLRMALGARRRDILSMFLRHSASTALLGSVVGAAAALGLARLMTSLLYQVSAADPWPFLAGGMLLNVTALAAALIPARRAARANPQEVLRAVP